MPARILVVDDSQQNLIQVELFLDSREFAVTTATNGPDALTLLARQEFDLVLLDVVLPGMDGLTICRRMQTDPRTARIPVLFLTGRARDEAAKVAAFEAGAVDFLTKPFGRAELVARVRGVLALHRRLGELEDQAIALREQLAVAVDGARAAQAERDLFVERVDDALDADRLGRIVVVGDRIVAADEALLALADCPGLAAGVPLAAAPPALVRLIERTRSAADGLVRVNGRDDDGLEALAIGDGHTVVLRAAAAGRDLHRFVDGRRGASFEAVEPADGYRIRQLVGDHAELRGLADTVDRLRNVRAPVLIVGETGTGKELVARALHYDGRYHDRPFIPIHCGAIAPELIESELFGYERGAFTGAQTSKDGLFTAADGGTVFLDEIAECSFDLQVKLLRVLQLGEVRPVGATHARHVDVRILAATNGDLAQLVRERRFREDLYYRLECVTLCIPPLRERIDDLPLLIDHFLQRFREQLRPPQPVEGLSAAALDAMRRYPWPGNVRELENVVKGLVALGRRQIAHVEDLPRRIVAAANAELDIGAATPAGIASGSVEPLDGQALAVRQARADRDAILDALERFGGDKPRAARWLGVSRATFYRKLKSLRDDDGS